MTTNEPAVELSPLKKCKRCGQLVMNPCEPEYPSKNAGGSNGKETN